MQLTIFYDGFCPLCVAEMKQLAELDRDSKLLLVDIHSAGFVQRYPHIDPAAADRLLHGQLSNGRLIYGLDVTHQAWRLVGRKPWIAVLRWPVIRWIADAAYRVFARYRYGFSYLLTGQRRCASCALKSNRHGPDRADRNAA